MAVQERYFGTFFQRVLAAPLDVRMHYGHPDIVDKLHFLTRGGCSSASKEINLSEDVFAGYKTTLRGGRVVFKEYHQLGKGRMTNLGEIHGFFAKLSQGAAGQLMSRDVYRITRLLPTERLVSVLCGGFGFYLMDALAMNFTFSLAYVFALLSVTGLLPFFKGSVVGFVSLTAWLPLLFALVRTLPDILLVLVESGGRKAAQFGWGKLLTFSPLYYIFLNQTRCHHFATTLRWGGADYFRTNRAVAIAHTPFHELYLSYAHSHFYPAADMLALLTVALGDGARPPTCCTRRGSST